MAADGGTTGLEPDLRPGAPPIEDRSPAPSADDGPAPGRGRKRLIRWALFLLLPIVLIVGAYFYITSGRYVSIDDALIEADTVAVSTDVSGIVKGVAVADNQPVEAGEVLFRLDDLPFRLALSRAEAQLGTVRETIGSLEANYRDVQAQIARAQDDIAFYQREFDRQQALYARHVSAQAVFDQARHNLRTAQQQLASLQQQLAAIAAKLDGDPDLPLDRHPLYRAALAARDEAARQLAHTVVKAPFAGIATNVPSLQPGMYLQASTPGFSIVATDHMWVEAQAKETELTYVRAGQPATVTVDTYPGRRWHGDVASISPASASQFALLPAENTSGNWVKVVQRIPIRVRIDPAGTGLPPLRAGMSAEVSVDTGRQHGVRRVLAGFFDSLWNG